MGIIKTCDEHTINNVLSIVNCVMRAGKTKGYKMGH